MPPAQDYKRIGDGDEGPNTGGMGSYSPVTSFGMPEAERVVETVHRPVLAELERRGTPFVGLLYAGLMLTDDGPRVLEFNCRFGDPETQSILPRLDGDLLPALATAAQGPGGWAKLDGTDAAVTIVLASRAYPERSDSGTPITGVAGAEATGAFVFHAGTALHDGRLVTNGGRILNVTATAPTVAEARERAYAAAALIEFEGKRLRGDIASSTEALVGG
jgi:phosphoribosylamine--glycine ligase